MCHRNVGVSRIGVVVILVSAWFSGGYAKAQTPTPIPPAPAHAPEIPPSSSVDLMSPAGMSVLGAQWRYMDASIVEVPALPNAGPQWKKTYDV